MRQPDTLDRERWQSVRRERISALMDRVETELFRAMDLHRKRINSPHEGYAVILEELNEVWELVREKRPMEHSLALEKELVQVAAMACRTIIDLELDAEVGPASSRERGER